MSPDVGMVWHAVTAAALAWLGIFFGRTLAPGKMPMIERIARVSEPDLNPALALYTRRLTIVWCGYFCAGALLAAALLATAYPVGLLFGAGSAALFVGEHWLRHRLFPGQPFPNLVQQVRDTIKAWH
ncbi:MAG TPA: hypothetical protein VIE63_08660 [Ramlibacter sp.]